MGRAWGTRIQRRVKRSMVTQQSGVLAVAFGEPGRNNPHGHGKIDIRTSIMDNGFSSPKAGCDELKYFHIYG